MIGVAKTGPKGITFSISTNFFPIDPPLPVKEIHNADLNISVYGGTVYSD